MRKAIILGLMALFTPAAHATEPSPAVAPSPCAAKEYKEFGFWVGSWDVTQNGDYAGSNTISWVDGGCAVMERWTSAAGNFTGHSLNAYDRTTDSWHQTWVDSTGNILRLEGGLEDGIELAPGQGIQAMVLRGETRTASGSTVQHRIRWTPMADGSVQQLWEQSEDGRRWTTAFDGVYRKRSENE